ncbi:MAG: copper chaperone PCu(A)C [Anaerolineales bacterium]|nr:copper chaperone PCu(A)C [Anaerolineales bacterium]
MKYMKLILTFALAVFVISACGGSLSELVIQGAWARPASAGENGAAYFVIENWTMTDDILLSVSSEIASATEVHMSMADANGVMSMLMQESIPVPAKATVKFEPGGLHVMFVNLNRNLIVGDTFTLILLFEKAGEVSLQVKVKEQ